MIQLRPVTKRVILATSICVASGFSWFIWTRQTSPRPWNQTAGSVTSSSPDVVAAKADMPPWGGFPTLPDDASTNASNWPDPVALHLGYRQIGVSTLPDDAAAVWVLDIADRHPSPVERARAINSLSRFFSRGRSGEFLAASITNATKEQVIEALWKAAGSDDMQARRSAMSALVVGRAHHDGDPVLTDAITRIYEERENYDLETRAYVETMWRQDREEQQKNRSSSK